MARIPLVKRYMRPMKKEALEKAERMLRLVRIPTRPTCSNRTRTS